MTTYRLVFLSKLRRNQLPQTSGRRHRCRSIIHAFVSVFLGITPRHWVIGSQISETNSCFDTSGTDYPVQRRHIPEELNHHCENPKICNKPRLAFVTESRGQVSITQVVLNSYLDLNIAYPDLRFKCFLCLSRQN